LEEGPGCVRRYNGRVVLLAAPAAGERKECFVVPSTMKAAVVRAFDRPVEIEERPVPEPGPEQVLVRVMASGVCHTDLHAARGDWPVKPKLPFVPGHEGVGYVAALGRTYPA
jgi:D-arabinose 1-dehydrogenase-like Zn-dependent alcohol dehydrogenase